MLFADLLREIGAVAALDDGEEALAQVQGLVKRGLDSMLANPEDGEWQARGMSVWCKGNVVANTNSGRLTVAQNEANARLCAAAPVMLGLLERFLVENERGDWMRDLAIEARAVIERVNQRKDVICQQKL